MTLTLLSALAEIQDIQDFRLRDFMSRLGLDERQPSTFYRELLKESRDAMRLIRDLQNRLATSDKAKSQMETNVSSQQRQIADLRTKTSSLENESQQRINELESENRQLKAIASELHEKAENYEGIKDFLKGRMNIDGLRALCDVVSATYEKALVASIGAKHGLQTADLDRLAPIRKRLREDLMAVLQIPTDVLEERLMKAEKTTEAFKFFINRMYGGKG